MKKTTVILFVLLLFLTGVPVSGQLSPIAVAGWVYLESGLPASGAIVTVLNVDTSEYANTTTNVNGLYATTMSGNDGDIIQVTCSHLGEAAVNTVTVDLADVTQFCNLSLSLSIPPNALFTYSQFNLEGLPVPHGQVVFFYDHSTDANGVIVSRRWNFDDGHTSLNRKPRHTYEEDGIYDVTLKVTDNDGLTDTMSRAITVETEAATVSFPPLQPPLYPIVPYTIPEMYQLLRGDKLQISSEEIIIVVIDTGVTLRMFNNTDMNDITALYHPNYRDGLDDNGHGTAVNCIVHYALEQWAPNSTQYSIKALDENGECSLSVFIECLDMAKDLDPHIVTASIGIIGGPTDRLCRKVDELREKGIIVTAAAGNFGPRSGTILSPACGSSALAIGSIDPGRTILDRTNDIISVWSSRGPVSNIYPKPDMVAPGESILCPYLDGVAVKSGTSLATPFVGGGAMLLYSNNKFMLDLVETIYGTFGMTDIVSGIVENSLGETCFDKGDRDSYGRGIMDIEKANGLVFWKCLSWILLFVSIVVIIIIVIIVLYWFYKKKGKNLLYIFGRFIVAKLKRH